MKRLSLLVILTFLGTAGFVPACSSDDTSSPADGASGSAGAAGAGGSSAQDAGDHDAAQEDAGNNDSGATDAGNNDSGATDAGNNDSGATDGGTLDAGNADAAVPTSCSEIPADSCFSNLDCKKAADRCDNVGTKDAPLACCVPGTRGTKQSGEACTDSNDCVSGVCIEGNGKQLCSGACKNKSECPDGMKDCRYIAGSGSPDDWCFPTK